MLLLLPPLQPPQTAQLHSCCLHRLLLLQQDRGTPAKR
jgi:hypothetical protein